MYKTGLDVGPVCQAYDMHVLNMKKSTLIAVR